VRDFKIVLKDPQPKGIRKVLIEQAFREYREPMLRAMIRFSGDEQAAGDAVSQTFTQALMHKYLLETMPEPAMKAWLYAAARNALVDMKRRTKYLRNFLVEELAQDHQVDLTDRITVAALLVKLPPELREPVRMKYFEGMNAAEIGRALNLIPATVRTRLRRAINLMRGIMEGAFYE
jgi:RNA polymerase sigma-70 factor (ECF subfamily)